MNDQDKQEKYQVEQPKNVTVYGSLPANLKMTMIVPHC